MLKPTYSTKQLIEKLQQEDPDGIFPVYLKDLDTEWILPVIVNKNKNEKRLEITADYNMKGE